MEIIKLEREIEKLRSKIYTKKDKLDKLKAIQNKKCSVFCEHWSVISRGREIYCLKSRMIIDEDCINLNNKEINA